MKALLLLASLAYGSSWEPAYFQRQEYNTPTYGYTTCFYKLVYGDYAFSIVTKGTCPYTVKINLETQQVSY